MPSIGFYPIPTSLPVSWLLVQLSFTDNLSVPARQDQEKTLGGTLRDKAQKLLLLTKLLQDSSVLGCLEEVPFDF